MNEIAQLIKQSRKARKRPPMTQLEVCAEVEKKYPGFAMGQSTLSMIESGERLPGLLITVAIADAVGITPKQVFEAARKLLETSAAQEGGDDAEHHG